MPRYTGTPYPFQILQLPDKVVILYEGASHMYRTIYTDGRKHTNPDALNPTWMGESIGHYEGNDTFVVDTIGFNGRTWLDSNGHPATDALRLTEKFHRPDFGHMEIEITIDDPKTYTKPWTVKENPHLLVDTELMEYICNENEKDRQHLVRK